MNHSKTIAYPIDVELRRKRFASSLAWNAIRVDRSSGAEETLPFRKSSCAVFGVGVRGWYVEFIDDGNLEEIHLGGYNDHVIRSYFHPVGRLKRERFTRNLQ